MAVAVLAVAFFSGGNIEKAREQAQQTQAAALDGASSEKETALPETAANTESAESIPATTAPVTAPQSSAPAATAPASAAQTAAAPAATAPKTDKNEKPSATVPSAAQPATKPTVSPTKPPVKPTEPTKPAEAPYCTISVSCATVFDNLAKLDDGIEEMLPSDGRILPEIKVALQDGDTAFSVLQRVCREENIPMEFVFTPAYGSDYVEGIGNLYEFDCGGNSGWMYCVNGVFPNVGSSQVSLSSGDRIEWKYTCNLGYDIGGGK